MKTTSRVLIALATLAAAGCAARHTTEPGSTELTGTWQWVRSAGGIAGRTFAPESEHYSVQFRFTNNTLSILRNDSLKATVAYSYGDTITYQPAINVFAFDPQMDRHIVRVLDSDSISLADPCCDRYDHVFVRVH